MTMQDAAVKLDTASKMLGTAARKLRDVHKHSATYSNVVKGSTILSMFGLTEGASVDMRHDVFHVDVFAMMMVLLAFSLATFLFYMASKFCIAKVKHYMRLRRAKRLAAMRMHLAEMRRVASRIDLRGDMATSSSSSAGVVLSIDSESQTWTVHERATFGSFSEIRTSVELLAYLNDEALIEAITSSNVNFDLMAHLPTAYITGHTCCLGNNCVKLVNAILPYCEVADDMSIAYGHKRKSDKAGTIQLKKIRHILRLSSYFGGLAFQNKAFSNQNKGHQRVPYTHSSMVVFGSRKRW